MSQTNYINTTSRICINIFAPTLRFYWHCYIYLYLDSHYYVLVSLLTKTTGFTISGQLCQLITRNLAGKREMRKQSKHKMFLFWKQVNYYEIWLFVFISSIMWKLTCLQMSSIRLASQELSIFWVSQRICKYDMRKSLLITRHWIQ